MSEESMVYGAIIGASGSTKNWDGLYKRNLRIIGALPEKDEVPPIEKQMFNVPMPTVGSGLYRSQVISFGLSINHMSEYWHVWIIKFEALLKTMYWWEVLVHLKIELYGEYQYYWKNDSDFVHLKKENPEPVSSWKFEGGPRTFIE